MGLVNSICFCSNSLWCLYISSASRVGQGSGPWPPSRIDAAPRCYRGTGGTARVSPLKSFLWVLFQRGVDINRERREFKIMERHGNGGCCHSGRGSLLPTGMSGSVRWRTESASVLDSGVVVLLMDRLSVFRHCSIRWCILLSSHLVESRLTSSWRSCRDLSCMVAFNASRYRECDVAGTCLSIFPEFRDSSIIRVQGQGSSDRRGISHDGAVGHQLASWPINGD